MVKDCQIYQYDATNISIFEEEDAVAVPHFVNSLQDNQCHWLDFKSLSNKEQVASLLEKLGLDKLINEEIYSDFRRSKFIDFETVLYFKVKSVLPKKKNEKMIEDKLSFVMGPNYVLTFQEKDSDHFIDVIEVLKIEMSRVRSRGVDFLLYKLLDAIMDNYSETLDNLSDEIEALRSKIHSKKATDSDLRSYLKEIEKQKRNLMSLRRIVFPIKDISAEIQHLDTINIKKENKLYFKKLSGSCSWIVEEIDANRQVLEGLTNICYATSNQRLNEIIKLLTLVSTIFIPLTFIVGVYGMNFENIPELKLKSGYYFVWLLMIFIAILMVIYFWRKGWFKKVD